MDEATELELQYRKEEIERLTAQVDKFEGALASTTDLLNTWARESSVEEAGNILEARDVADRLWARNSKQINKLKAQVAELKDNTEYNLMMRQLSGLRLKIERYEKALEMIINWLEEHPYNSNYALILARRAWEGASDDKG